MKARFKKYIKKLWKILSNPEMAILPGNLAFYFFLALVPILTIIVLIASKFSISLDLITELINEMMPTKVASTLIGVISGQGFDGKVGLFNIVAFILSTNGTYAIITTSNTLYKVQYRDVIRDRIKSVILLLLIISSVLFILVVPVFGSKILLFIKNTKVLSFLSNEVIFIFNILKWPFTFIILYYNVKLIYLIAPSTDIKSKETTIGALFTTIVWIVSSIVFGYYLQYFAKYDIIYGNISSIIIIMMWMFLLSYFFVVGLAINSTKHIEKHKNV